MNERELADTLGANDRLEAVSVTWNAAALGALFRWRLSCLLVR
jgi:hypothetical protein